MSAAHFWWLVTGSTDSPMILTPRLSNSGFSRAMVPSSVVQTGVKSFGCENSTTQLLPIQSWKRILPSVVSASKSGAVSPIASAIKTSVVDPGFANVIRQLIYGRNRHVTSLRGPQLFGAAKNYSGAERIKPGRFDQSPYPAGKILRLRFADHRSLSGNSADLPQLRPCAATLGLELRTAARSRATKGEGARVCKSATPAAAGREATDERADYFGFGDALRCDRAFADLCACDAGTERSAAATRLRCGGSRHPRMDRGRRPARRPSAGIGLSHPEIDIYLLGCARQAGRGQPHRTTRKARCVEVAGG